MPNFSEVVRGDDDAVANWCEVEADDYFVHVSTDPYEGHAMFHVSVARKLRDALDRAIRHVESTQRAGQ
jgi:hypothetical protein